MERVWGEGDCCSMLSSLECPHSVGALPSWRLPAWGWCTMSQLDLLYMVCCVLRDLYRIRHRHRQRQQQETALVRWVIPSCILCMSSHTFHLHVQLLLFTAPKYSGIMGWTHSIWGLKYLSIGFTQVQTHDQMDGVEICFNLILLYLFQI